MDLPGLLKMPEARPWMGKSKTSFGLERLEASRDMDLIEFGLYNGAGDGLSGDEELDDDKDLAGRNPQPMALPDG